jgi:uncharacterized protein (TIGR00299 family) protein
MKTLYIECKMGAAGDMLMAALYELLDESEKKEFVDTMSRLLGEDLTVTPAAGTSCGIGGTHMQVEVLHTQEDAFSHCLEHSENETAMYGEPEHSESAAAVHDHADEHQPHAHYTYASILAQIDRLALPGSVKADAAAVYRLIGEAEAAVHGCELSQIHFHEVGSLDAIADVAGCCLLFAMLKPDAIYASPIHVGNGTVRCAHGILPVPAPATAEILKGIPYYTGAIASELCTPTGAAILKYFAAKFIPMPVMTVSDVGIGLGTKEFAQANCVRIFLGETESNPAAPADGDLILELSCNLDDMTGEELGFAMEVLFDAGAYEVFYESVYMKKNRPGILLHCFCSPSDKERFTKLIFQHTSTRGVRYHSFSRAKLTARFEEISTEYGPVRKKINEGFGLCKSKYEYEDLRRIAKEQGLSIAEVRNLLS